MNTVRNFEIHKTRGESFYCRKAQCLFDEGLLHGATSVSIYFTLTFIHCHSAQVFVTRITVTRTLLSQSSYSKLRNFLTFHQQLITLAATALQLPYNSSCRQFLSYESRTFFPPFLRNHRYKSPSPITLLGNYGALLVAYRTCVFRVLEDLYTVKTVNVLAK